MINETTVLETVILKHMCKMTKEQFEKWMTNLKHIISDINVCMNNMQRIEQNECVEIESIKREPFFQHHWYQLRFILIIQLAKLFQHSSNQKITFRKLLNVISNGEYDDELNKLFQKNIVSNEENLINSKADVIKIRDEIHALLAEKKDLIFKLSEARNKLYAHHDPDVQVEFILTSELQELVSLANSIYNIIQSKFFNLTTMLSITTPWDIGTVLNRMVQHN